MLRHYYTKKAYFYASEFEFLMNNKMICSNHWGTYTKGNLNIYKDAYFFRNIYILNS